MDNQRKWTIYMVFLVAGFSTGIGTLGLFPQFWLKYGITGMAIHLVFLALFSYIAIIEAETVMRSGYYFVELYNKVAKKPAMVLSILAVVIMFLSYYAANTMLSILSPIVGTGTFGRLVAKIIMLAIAFVVLTRAKEKTFTIMAIGSLIFTIAVFITAIAFKTQIPENATFLGLAKHMMVANVPVSLSMIRDAALRAAYGVGLGFGFYIMLGSFLTERFNVKVIISAGILVQFIMSLLATLIVVYAIAPTTPDRLLLYVHGGEEGAISLMGELPQILKNYPTLLLLIAISVFFAGVTSLLPTSEIGLQIIESTLKVNRNKAAMYLIGAALLLGLLDSPPQLADMVLKAVTVAMFFTAIYELYPVIIQEKGRSRVIAGVTAILFAIGGIYALISTAKMGTIYIASVILAIIVVIFGWFGNEIMKKEEAI